MSTSSRPETEARIDALIERLKRLGVPERDRKAREERLLDSATANYLMRRPIA